jgi:vitamin B12 transporter
MSRPWFGAATLLAATFAPLFGDLAAQSASSPATRDTTKRDSLAARAQRMEGVTVVGALSSTGQVAPGAIPFVIPRARLDAEPMRMAVDPLRAAAGVHIDQATGPLGPTIIRLRGSEEQYTQVLVDGMSVSENGGFFDWQGLTLVNVDRVEIARGPQSTVYGSSAMSGAVRLVTRRGEDGPMQGNVMVEGARTSRFGGGWRSTMDLRGGNDWLRYSAGLGTQRERGVYSVANDLHSDDASLRLDALPSNEFALTGTIRYMGSAAMLPVRDPGTTRVPLDPNQRQSRFRTVGTLEATWTPSESFTHRLTVGRYHLMFTYDDSLDNVPPAALLGAFNANYHLRTFLDRTTARYVGTLNGRGDGDALSFGAEYEREELADTVSGDFGPTLQAIGRTGVAAFAEGQWRFGSAASVLVGARLQHYPGVATALVPRIAGTFATPLQHLSARVAIGSAFTAPNIQVQYADPGFFIGNPNLKPEHSASIEGGLDFATELGTISGTIFAQRYDELIRVVPYDSTRLINDNLGRISSTGLELEGALKPIHGWDIGGSMAWLHTNVNDNRGLDPTVFPNGEPLPFRPTYTGGAFVTLPDLHPLKVTVRVIAIGPQTTITSRFSGTREPIPSYQTVNLSVRLPIGARLEAYSQIENIFNSGYLVAYDRPGAPRSIALGLRSTFGGR